MVKMKEGEVLQYYRRNAKLTQREMAKLTGLSKNYISAVERGINTINSSALLIYMKVCNIPLEAFF